jgi:hypothetical protein
MAGVARLTAANIQGDAEDSGRKKSSLVIGCFLSRAQARGFDRSDYFLPKRLRNFSTRPPMLSTDFWVPV